MAEPQSWGGQNTPYITAKGRVIDRDVIKRAYWNGKGTKKHTHLGFAGWMTVCNAVCVTRTGLSCEDFADQTWFDWYEDHVQPREAVKMLLENEGWAAFLASE